MEPEVISRDQNKELINKTFSFYTIRLAKKSSQGGQKHHRKQIPQWKKTKKWTPSCQVHHETADRMVALSTVDENCGFSNKEEIATHTRAWAVHKQEGAIDLRLKVELFSFCVM